eukprot:365150-Chlamydomonas_euryale.AAC.6
MAATTTTTHPCTHPPLHLCVCSLLFVHGSRAESASPTATAATTTAAHPSMHPPPSTCVCALICVCVGHLLRMGGGQPRGAGDNAGVAYHAVDQLHRRPGGTCRRLDMCWGGRGMWCWGGGTRRVCM